MDILSLKKYHRLSQEESVDKTLKVEGYDKENQVFIEFFINDIPLSKLLDQFYGSKDSILRNWTGVLGSSNNPNAEIIKVQQLLGKKVTDRDIRSVFPASWSKAEFQNFYRLFPDGSE